MAQLAIQLAFAGLGNSLGLGIPALGLSGAGVGSIVGSFVSSWLFPPPDVEGFGPRLSDLSITASTYGKTIPICYGTVPVAGDIIDSSSIYEKSHTETEEAGKGGGQEVSYTTYTYSVDLAVGLCEGPIVGVLQIFANEKLIYDARPGSSFIKPSWLDLTVYQGTETQEPDPTLEALHGAGEVPGYRGLAYVVFPRFQLESFGNRIPTFRFVVVTNGDKTINETVTDISDDGGTSHGPVYSSKTGLLYASAELSTTAGLHQLKALDPFSKNIVWTTNMIDPSGDAMDELQKPTLVGDYVVVGGSEPVGGVPPARIGFVDANSGYVYNVQELQQTTGTVLDLVPLYDDQLVFLHPTDGVTGPDFMSVYSFGGVGFSQTRQKILDPSGWRVMPGVPAAVKKGSVPIICCEVDSTSTSDIGVALWSGDDRPLSGEFTPNYTIVNLGSTSSVLHAIHYNEHTDSFWIGMGTNDTRVEVVEVDLDGNATVYNWNTLYSISEFKDLDPLFGPDFENGYLWVRTDQDLYRWDIENLTTPVAYDDTTAIRDFHYEPVTQAMWGAVSDDIVEYQHNRLQDQQVQLSSIVDDLSDRVGLSASDTDSSELDAINVRGYVIGNITSARSALEPLRRAFLFDHSDTGGSIDFRTFGQSVSKTLGVDDIGAHAYGDSAPPLIEISREQESSLPKELSITYMDVGANYEVGHQRARFIATDSVQSIGIELPIVLSYTEAAQKADVLLHLAHIEREGYVVHAMPVHSDLVPADVIQVTDDNAETYRMKIGEIVKERGVLKMTCVRDEPNVLVSNAVGAQITGRDATIFLAGIMQFELLNLPALRDADMAAGFYVAGYSYSDNWPGGVVFRTDDGSSFLEVKTVDTAATIGRVWNEPETAIPFIMDDISSLDISLYNGELSSVTEAQLIAGDVNAAAYGADDRWEIVQFQTATLEATGRYTVSGLLRGRLGTEHAMDQHQAGDLFIVLDTGTLERITTNQADIGSDYTYRGVTLSRSIYDNTNLDKAHTHRGTGLIPLSVSHLESETEADLDVLITWRPRTRYIWADFWSGIESDADLYDIEIYDGSTLLRTYSSVINQYQTYSRTDQETDLGADTTDTVTVKVYHVSSIVGRGTVAELSVDLGPPPNSLKTYALSLSPYFYWLMDITTGTEVASIGTSSGARAVMDLYGGEAIKQPSLMTNKHGFSIKFNGADWGYPLDSYPTQAGANANKTTAFVIKLGGNPTGDSYIHYLKGTGGAASWSAMRVMLTSARKIKFQMRDAADTAWNELLSTTTLAVGTVYFIVASIGADGQKLYINGTLEDSDSGVTTHLTTTGWIYPHYGDDNDFGTTDIPDIYFDQLLFWYNKQLTDDEVTNMAVRI